MPYKASRVFFSHNDQDKIIYILIVHLSIYSYNMHYYISICKIYSINVIYYIMLYNNSTFNTQKTLSDAEMQFVGQWQVQLNDR